MEWSIDGVTWNIPCTIERRSDLTSSDVSGLLLNHQYLNDVIGTFVSYSVTIAVPFGMESQYSTLYEILTQPVDGHSFIFPYGETTITFTGRIQTVSDVYVRLPGGKQTWRKTKFECIANHPSKWMDLTEVITRGMTPVPNVPNAEVGDLYEKTSGGWIQRFYTDADNEEY